MRGDICVTCAARPQLFKDNKMDLVVSMGDPSGIGPEIAVKAWKALSLQNESLKKENKFVIIGDFETLKAECDRQGTPPPRLILNIEESEELDFSANLLVLSPLSLAQTAISGKPNSKNAAAIIKYIEYGAQLCHQKRAKALITLPIAKSVLYGAGFGFPGHTEYIADLCGKWTDQNIEPLMMLMADNVKVALVTIHTPLLLAAQNLTGEAIEFAINQVSHAMQNDFAIHNPEIAVLGLNPHAGENGDIGREEIEIINPICQKLRAKGINCTDAIPADSAFSPDKRDRFDAYVAMYHDQGLIPVKTIDFWGGVNVTLGLPIIRTSPDHGTGFDIAGRGIANPLSFLNAIKTANEIYKNREKALI